MITTWLRMPQLAEIEYVYGFRAAGNKINTVIGNVIHFVLEMSYKSDKIPSLEKIYHLIEQACVFYPLDEFDKWKVKAILTAYLTVKMPDDFKTRKTERTEYRFREEFMSIPLNGLVDWQWSPNSITDHKCTGRFQTEELLTLGSESIQANMYMFVMECCNFEFNYIKIPTTKRSTRENESGPDYYKRLLEKSLLKKPDEYFLRIPIQKRQIDVMNWAKTTLTGIINDMRVWWNSEFAYPSYTNVAALGGQWGLSPYASLMLYNDMTNVKIKTKPFEELPDGNTTEE